MAAKENEQPVVVQKPVSKQYLRHLHYLRGLAILNIALAHVLSFPDSYSNMENAGVMRAIAQMLFHGSTLYFLFISGYLFYHLSGGFNVWTYYKKKFLYVILPFILISIPFALLKFRGFYLDSSISFSDKLLEMGNTLLHGSATIQFWYIPFIALVFLISPLFLLIPEKYYKTVFIIACILPLLGTRTGSDITVKQFIYFLPVYFIGIYARKENDWFIGFLQRGRWGLALILLITSVYLFVRPQNPTVFGAHYNLIEAMFYLQKMAFLGICFHLLYNLRESKIVLLELLGTYSFAIYFLHTLVDSSEIRQVVFDFFMQISTQFFIPVYIFYSLFTIAVTLAICMGIKFVLGKTSRYLIGA